jgi:hypothetical protein
MVPLHPIRSECFGSRAFIASLKNEEVVYFQGTSSNQLLLLTSSPLLERLRHCLTRINRVGWEMFPRRDQENFGREWGTNE